jgi:hypothetical protein
MPKITYQPQNFTAATLDVITVAEGICEDYAAQGYNLTLRQLYYQFVARALIPNTQQSYKRLGDIVSNGRLGGLIDWNHISDRTRSAVQPVFWTDPESIIESAARSYNIEMWRDQAEYVEVWVEKEALADVIGQAADRRDATYFACKGYTSQSEMWAAARRLVRKERAGKRTTVIHLGDHDPSGLDMTRDIADRLAMFGSKAEVKRVALNMDQVEQYQPPPNPAKVTDSRYADYQEAFGEECWELDALDPAVLDALVTAEVESHIDMAAWAASAARLASEREALTAAAENWADVLFALREQGHLGDPDEEDGEAE